MALEVKIAITPKANNLSSYEILDLIVVGGRAYLSNKQLNTSPVTDVTAWEKITENTYDIAVRNGYVGTEPEWLDSLKFDYVTTIGDIDTILDNINGEVI